MTEGRILYCGLSGMQSERGFDQATCNGSSCLNEESFREGDITRSTPTVQRTPSRIPCEGYCLDGHEVHDLAVLMVNMQCKVGVWQGRHGKSVPEPV